LYFLINIYRKGCNKMYKKLVLIILSFFLIFIFLFPGCQPATIPDLTGSTISGQAALPGRSSKNITGYTPIPGATVTVIDNEGNIHTTLTDSNGFYSFDNISVKVNTIIYITKDTEDEGKIVFMEVIPEALSPEENFYAGIADAESTALALVIEALINLGQPQEEIDLEEIISAPGFASLEEAVRQAQESNQDIMALSSIITQAQAIADYILNPPSPTPAPTPAPTPIDIAVIPGVTAPVTGATPVTTITATAQYTGTVAWGPADDPFLGSIAYTAMITLTAKAGFTLTGVAANFFTVDGATATNSSNSGVVTAVFPETVLNVGDSYGGGIVAYILQSGDPGYDANVQHGLIAATIDQSTGIQWYNGSSVVTGATGIAIGFGLANTAVIVNIQGAGSYAAQLCNDLDVGGYDDWFLPSKDELDKLYIDKVAIGGFTSDDYWSSSENNKKSAWKQNFNDGNQKKNNKKNNKRVRAVRAF